MDDTGGPQDEDLAETTHRQNSNLRRLIDAVGTLLAGSRELLKRLQPEQGEPPDDTAQRQTERRPEPCRQTSRSPPTWRKVKVGTELHARLGVWMCGHLHPAPPPGSMPQSTGGSSRAPRFRTSP